jgi:arylsulfatase A-like enzyme
MVKGTILLIVDQYVFPPVWETPTIKEFRKEKLPTLTWIQENSVNFLNHYIATGACVPSRASIMTGLMPNNHNVWNTDGVAKSQVDWLNPEIHPTIGNIIKNSGKITPDNIVYIGKQHLTKDIEFIDQQTNRRLESIDKCGNLIPKHMQIYQEANVLDKFGFKLLNGPDPHGPQETNAGILVDKVYVDMAIKKINTFTEDYFMVLSLVEPHDIVYHPYLWRLWSNPNPQMNFNNADLTGITDNEDISVLPLAYRNWVQNYGKYFATQNVYSYRSFYYYLLTILDAELAKLFDCLKSKDVTLFFTSDHGDMLGSHGGGYQKWYSLFEEVTHVPFNIINFKSIIKKDVIALTSHIDILPTILDEMGILATTYLNFDGRSLYSLLNNHSLDRLSIRCDLRDHITLGENTIRFPARFFPDLLNDFNIRFESVASEHEAYAVMATWVETDEGIIKTIEYYNPNTMIVSYTMKYNISIDPCETILLN